MSHQQPGGRSSGSSSSGKKEKDGDEEGEEETDAVAGVEGGRPLLRDDDEQEQQIRRLDDQQQQQQRTTTTTAASGGVHDHDGHDDGSSSSSTDDALQEAFLDPVTLCLLERPVTLSCGHNLSKSVLKEMRRVGHKRCPSCQAETIGVTGQRLTVNLLLERTIDRLFPGKVPRMSQEDVRREWCEEAEEEKAFLAAKAQRAAHQHDFGPHTDWHRLCGAEVSLPLSLYEPQNQPCCTALAYALSHQRPARSSSQSDNNNNNNHNDINDAGSSSGDESSSTTSSDTSSETSSDNSSSSGSPPRRDNQQQQQDDDDDDDDDDSARLEYLDLSETGVGPAGIMALCAALLSGVVRIEHLSLAGQSITDQTLLALVHALREAAGGGNKKKAATTTTSDIFRLCIRGKQVTDVGVMAMIRALVSSSSESRRPCSMDDLRLESDSLTDQALTLLAKTLRSGRCPHLSFLCLSGRGLSSGLMDLCKALASTTRGQQGQGGGGVSKLEALSLPPCSSSSLLREVAGLLRLPSHSREGIKRIVLHGSQVGEVGARALVQALMCAPPQLANLIINDVSVTDKGARALADLLSSGACPRLKTVCLRDAPEGDERLSVLEAMTRSHWFSPTDPSSPTHRTTTSPRFRALLQQQRVDLGGAHHGEEEEGQSSSSSWVERGVRAMVVLTDEVLLSAVQDMHHPPLGLLQLPTTTPSSYYQ